MLSSGTQIGPYEIVSLLGSGGMGDVYRARDSRLGRTVALKILPAEVAGDTGRRQRFEQEARAASALNHPNIVTVYDAGTDDGVVYLVSELIEGETLRERIRAGPLAQSKALEIAVQVADALAAAHTAGIVHRDLKPENIMVTRDGRAKVLDFGLAKQVSPVAAGSGATDFLTQTSPGAVLGTAAYMSPEQVRGETLDARSDLFSFGLVLHEMLSGRQAFERNTAVEVMTAILREDAPELPETVTPALRRTVAHCLEKEVGRRFDSARDLAFALGNVGTLSRPSGEAAALDEAAGRSRPKNPRGVPAGAAIAVLTVLALGFAALWLRAPEPLNLEDYRFTPFANEHEPETDAAWSPDGKSIAYIKPVNGIPQLMVRSLDAAVPVALTSGPDEVSRPFWSPNAALVYYLLRKGRGELWGVSPAGGRATRILDDLDCAAISPDGKSLALWRVTLGLSTGGPPRGSVWISSPPGAPPRRYEPAPFETSAPEANEDAGESGLWFSPDGASLLLAASGLSPELWLLPFPDRGGRPRRLFASTEFRTVPRAGWLPGGSQAVLSFAAGSAEPALWLADLTKQKLRKLTAGTSAEESPSPSPDGKRLVFTSTTNDYNLLDIPLDGTLPCALLAGSRNMYSPSWSPKGDQFAYSTDRDGVREIWFHNAKAGLDRPGVTPGDFEPGTTLGLADPVFSADGNRLAFVRYSTKEPPAIWFEVAAGGAPIRLASEWMVAPTWSPDGSSIAGLLQREGSWHPAIVGVGANMQPHVVAHVPVCLSALEWSPAGDWIACQARDGISLFSSGGSKSRMLPVLDNAVLAFSRDGHTIYAAGRTGGRGFLRAVDVATGGVRVLSNLGEVTISGGAAYQSRLSVSPDGKSLATSAVTSKSDLWLLEGYPLKRPWRLW